MRKMSSFRRIVDICCRHCNLQWWCGKCQYSGVLPTSAAVIVIYSGLNNIITDKIVQTLPVGTIFALERRKSRNSQNRRPPWAIQEVGRRRKSRNLQNRRLFWKRVYGKHFRTMGDSEFTRNSIIKKAETLKLQGIQLFQKQGMRESNSHQRFWRPLSYHLTNPLSVLISALLTRTKIL